MFNRSHYEDVLPVRVHRLVPEVWRRRRPHQRLRADADRRGHRHPEVLSAHLESRAAGALNERLDQPSKNWKFELGDLKERGLWDAYTEAYAEMLERCSTPLVPWYIVPADKQQPRDFLVAEAIVEALEGMNPQYPAADPAVLALRGR